MVYSKDQILRFFVCVFKIIVLTCGEINLCDVK